jgi:hypothetical protein
MGFYIGVEGHIKFHDRTELRFSSKGLDTSKVGDLDAKAAKKKAAEGYLARQQAKKIAAADAAALAKGNQSGHHGRNS